MIDPQSELLQKLKRQRRRMGEMCSPLKEIGNELPRSQPEADSKGRVRQRAMCFEGAENCASDAATPPGCAPAPAPLGGAATAPRRAVAASSPPVRRGAPALSPPVPKAARCPTERPGVAVLEAALGETAEALHAAVRTGAAFGERALGRAAALAGEAAALAEEAADAAESAALGAPAAPGGAAQPAAAGGAGGPGSSAPGSPTPDLQGHARPGQSGGAARPGARRRAGAVRYSIASGDQEEHGGSTGASETAPPEQVERGGACAARPDQEGYEPMEYAVLDYLGALPEGFMDKLKYSLDVHENLVRRLSRRNERLQAKVRERRASEGARAPAGHPPAEGARPARQAAPERDAPGANAPAAGSEVAGAVADAERGSCAPDAGSPQALAWARRRELQAQLAGKVQAAQEARRRLGAEAHEAALRARLARACGAAGERIAATARRTRREEREHELRAAAALREREGVQSSLKAALQEQSAMRARVAELEEALRLSDGHRREGERLRQARLREAEALRGELREHRARAARTAAAEARIGELERELRAARGALGAGAPAAGPRGHSAGPLLHGQGTRSVEDRLAGPSERGGGGGGGESGGPARPAGVVQGQLRA